MFGKKQKHLILTLLRLGEAPGLELVDLSGGFLKRGTVYVRLTELQEEGKVTARVEIIGPLKLPRRYYRLADPLTHLPGSTTHMQAIRQLQERFVLDLTREEAEWLKAVMQNPLKENETELDSELRSRYYNAFQRVL